MAETKFAVHAITENIREEVAPSNVRLITIAPQWVETPLLSHTTNEEIIELPDSGKEIQSGSDPEKIADWYRQFVYQQTAGCVHP